MAPKSVGNESKTRQRVTGHGADLPSCAEAVITNIRRGGGGVQGATKSAIKAKNEHLAQLRIAHEDVTRVVDGHELGPPESWSRAELIIMALIVLARCVRRASSGFASGLHWLGAPVPLCSWDQPAHHIDGL